MLFKIIEIYLRVQSIPNDSFRMITKLFVSPPTSFVDCKQPRSARRPVHCIMLLPVCNFIFGNFFHERSRLVHFNRSGSRYTPLYGTLHTFLKYNKYVNKEKIVFSTLYSSPQKILHHLAFPPSVLYMLPQYISIVWPISLYESSKVFDRVQVRWLGAQLIFSISGCSSNHSWTILAVCTDELSWTNCIGSPSSGSQFIVINNKSPVPYEDTNP